MEKKIFFIDFDGTLMRDDKTISDKNREALRNAVDQGHYIALATGRAVSSGRRIAKELGLTRPGCYLVAYNGGTIYDFSADCILSNKRLPIEYAEYLLREATEAVYIFRPILIHRCLRQNVVKNLIFIRKRPECHAGLPEI